MSRRRPTVPAKSIRAPRKRVQKIPSPTPVKASVLPLGAVRSEVVALGSEEFAARVCGWVQGAVVVVVDEGAVVVVVEDGEVVVVEDGEVEVVDGGVVVEVVVDDVEVVVDVEDVDVVDVLEVEEVLVEPVGAEVLVEVLEVDDGVLAEVLVGLDALVVVVVQSGSVVVVDDVVVLVGAVVDVVVVQVGRVVEVVDVVDDVEVVDVDVVLVDVVLVGEVVDDVVVQGAVVVVEPLVDVDVVVDVAAMAVVTLGPMRSVKARTAAVARPAVAERRVIPSVTPWHYAGWTLRTISRHMGSHVRVKRSEDELFATDALGAFVAHLADTVNDDERAEEQGSRAA
jgi:hypothetical protein